MAAAVHCSEKKHELLNSLPVPVLNSVLVHVFNTLRRFIVHVPTWNAEAGACLLLIVLVVRTSYGTLGAHLWVGVL